MDRETCPDCEYPAGDRALVIFRWNADEAVNGCRFSARIFQHGQGAAEVPDLVEYIRENIIPNLEESFSKELDAAIEELGNG